MARGGIIVLRDRAEFDPGEGAAVIPIPQVPGTWTVKPQGRTGWVHLIDPDGREYWWLTAIDGPDAGLPTKIVGFVSPIDAEGAVWLKQFAASNDRAWTIKELRTDGGAQATAIKAAWRMQRTVPGADPDVDPPVVVEPVAMMRTIAGFSFQTDAEVYDTVGDMPDA